MIISIGLERQKIQYARKFIASKERSYLPALGKKIKKYLLRQYKRPDLTPTDTLGLGDFEEFFL